MNDRHRDLRAASQYENDFSDMNDDEIHHEIEMASEVIAEAESWLEACTAMMRIRKDNYDD
jgi:hypothetical protein